MIISLILSTSLHAAEWTTWGDIRTTGDFISDFNLDDSQRQNDQSNWFRSRIILGTKAKWNSSLEFNLELEGLNGQYAGDFSEVGQGLSINPYRIDLHGSADLLEVWPRQLNLKWQSNRTQLSIGFQTFKWGLGILSNDGKQDPWFGEAHQGNIYFRAGGAIAPFSGPYAPIRLFAAADWVIRDDNVNIYAGDRAYAVIGGMMGGGTSNKWGILSGARWQTDREDTNHPITQTSSFIIPLDVFYTVNLGPLTLGAEVAKLWGNSNRLYNEKTIADGVSVDALGAALQARFQGGAIAYGLEAGYASGDSAPADTVSRQFQFHSDKNAGFILYEQVLPRLSGAAVDQLADPELSGSPAPGLRFAVNQGQISNSLYIQTGLQTQLNGWAVRLGHVYAHSAGGLIDPYSTAINGGYPVGYGGENIESKGLGHEVDISLRYAMPKDIRIQFVVDAGMLFAGDALAGLDIDRVWSVHGRVQALWGNEKKKPKQVTKQKPPW